MQKVRGERREHHMPSNNTVPDKQKQCQRTAGPEHLNSDTECTDSSKPGRQESTNPSTCKPPEKAGH